ncbi:MAG TPA: metallopeptidase TldD-related protein [Symbiobacteriaceae bacterium]|nr:metallopeptidase TldD-related protein [Symbiobacteriaceae bacterium]
MELTSRVEEMDLALGRALRSGGRHCDLVRTAGMGRAVRTRSGRILGDRVSQSDQLCVRVWRENGIGTASGRGVSAHGLVRAALHGVSPRQFPIRPADPAGAPDPALNPDPGDPPDPVEAAAQCEALVTAAGGRLIQCQVAWEQWVNEAVASTGLRVRWHRQVIELTCLFQVGDSHSHFKIRGTAWDRPAIAAALGWAAHLARVPVRAASEGSGRKLPVVLAPEAAAAVMTVVAAARRADWVAEGLSCLGGQPGDAIAGAALTVVDDPSLPGAGRRAFDAEGAACRPVLLVDQGRLAGCLYTLAAADAYGAPGSWRGGNAFRWEHADLPYPAISTLRIQAAGAGGDMLTAAPDAWLITEFHSLSAEAAATGLVSARVAAYRVRRGEVQYQAAAPAVSFSLPEWLLGVCGQIGVHVLCAGGVSAQSPHLLVEGMELTGI